MTRLPTTLPSALLLLAGLTMPTLAASAPRAFETPDAAVRGLIAIVKANDLAGLVTLFGEAAQDLVDTSDAATGRRNRQVFAAAVVEGWRLQETAPDRRELVLGNEAWPFPVPLVRTAAGWTFDAAAGREEVVNRRVGRNELAVLRALGDYVAAQRAYAGTAHDGLPAGRYARQFGSDPGRQNGLYWPARRGEPRSPLGVLAAEASEQGYRQRGYGPSPLHGYYFRILEGQGPAAKGGAAEYVVGGAMTGGFALVAWPVHYGASGVMTFTINRDGAAYEKDLGPETSAAVGRIARFEPDGTWQRVEAH